MKEKRDAKRCREKDSEENEANNDVPERQRQGVLMRSQAKFN